MADANFRANSPLTALDEALHGVRNLTQQLSAKARSLASLLDSVEEDNRPTSHPIIKVCENCNEPYIEQRSPGAPAYGLCSVECSLDSAPAKVKL